MDNKVIEKIQKLLALSKSSNEHEAQVAMLQVQKLMVKHKLTMAEVEKYDKKDITIKKESTNYTFRGSSWKGSLAILIAENFQCYTYVRVNYSKKIMFFGKDEDVAVCKIMMEYAVDYIKKEANKFKYKYKKNGYSTTGVENTYAVGFINGLRKAFEEQKEQNKEEWGLVLTKDSRVVKAYENMNLKKPKKKYPLTVLIDDEIKNKGYADGKKFRISDKISNEGEDNTLLLS